MKKRRLLDQLLAHRSFDIGKEFHLVVAANLH